MSHTPVKRGENLPERFDDPGLPPHRLRLTDVDPKAARRAERTVVAFFTLSALGTIFAICAYFIWKPEGNFASIQKATWTVGIGMAVSMLALGIGAVHWAKSLMPDTERVDERHPMRPEEATREDAAEILKIGGRESGLGRRPLIRNSLIGALALFPLPGIVLLRDLGPLPQTALRHTMWKKGTRLTTDPFERPIKAADLTLGSVYHVVPEGLKDQEDMLEQKAKAIVLLVRVDPSVIKDPDPARAGWDVDGIFAYSKVCTHVGCPVALYEQQTHHLLCPCHQSTFDLTQYCKVIFGPAGHALPQLPIAVDDQGYLVAQSDFHEPVGPSFWERG